MTAKEFYVEKIVPLRNEINELENEYEEIFLKEKAVENGLDRCTCDNCAFSCSLDIGEHNECLKGHCTCCYYGCLAWKPETELSKYIRQNYHYYPVEMMRLTNLFGKGFVAETNPTKVELIKQALDLMEKMEAKE